MGRAKSAAWARLKPGGGSRVHHLDPPRVLTPTSPNGRCRDAPHAVFVELRPLLAEPPALRPPVLLANALAAFTLNLVSMAFVLYVQSLRLQRRYRLSGTSSSVRGPVAGRHGCPTSRPCPAPPVPPSPPARPCSC